MEGLVLTGTADVIEPTTEETAPYQVITTKQQALAAFNRAWPNIVRDCRMVLGSELHYQAMLYHLLRSEGQVPLDQIGMNVKMFIPKPVTSLFQTCDMKKNERFRGGFEPIPDIVIFSPSVNADWRRRNNHNTLCCMLMAVEVKASERKNSRLTAGEVVGDIEKLAAHKEEALHRGCDMASVVVVIDTAPTSNERMRDDALRAAVEAAEKHAVSFFYVSPEKTLSLCLEAEGS